MNNIYVDELPKSCGDCSFCEKYGYYLYCSRLCKKLEYLDKEKECPLKPLTDRLAEERKKVVQEISGKGKKENVWNLTNNTSKEVLIIGTDILDQIERGE
jgi:hypothetical protein